MATLKYQRAHDEAQPTVCRAYRLGGRAYPLVRAGSFRTMKEARARRDLIAGEIAAGRNPALLLHALHETPLRRTLRKVFDEFIAARVDVIVKTLALYRNARDRLRSLADLDPNELTAAHVRSWISENSEACDEYAALSPKSLSHYLSSLRQVLEFADVQPNPARSLKVKLPTQATKEEVSPPSSVEWQAIKANISKQLRLVVRFIECEGVRISTRSRSHTVMSTSRTAASV